MFLFFVGIVDFVEMREEPRGRGRERGGRECCYGLMTPPSQPTKLTTSPHPSPSSSAGATPFCRHVLPLLVFSFRRGVRDVGRGEVDVWRIIVVAVGAFFFVSQVDGGWGGVVTNSWERGDESGEVRRRIVLAGLITPAHRISLLLFLRIWNCRSKCLSA